MVGGQTNRDTASEGVPDQMATRDPRVLEQRRYEPSVVLRCPGLRRILGLSESRQLDSDYFGLGGQRRNDRLDSLEMRSPSMENHNRQIRSVLEAAASNYPDMDLGVQRRRF